MFSPSDPQAVLSADILSDRTVCERARRAPCWSRRRRGIVGRSRPGIIGSFDLITSSRAIHHITPAAKQTLFADIYARLNPGGCFMDVDNMRPRDEFLRARYAQV